jgi:hypothetical protein
MQTGRDSVPQCLWIDRQVASMKLLVQWARVVVLKQSVFLSDKWEECLFWKGSFDWKRINQ